MSRSRSKKATINLTNLRDHVVPKKKKKKKEFITPSSWNKEVMGRPITELTDKQLSKATDLALTGRVDVFGRPLRSLEDILRK